MSENIDWLQVVLDYAKRFPNKQLKELGLPFQNTILNYELKELIYVYGWITVSAENAYGVFRMNTVLQFGSGIWVDVPQHILLKFLTEGMEDLI